MNRHNPQVFSEVNIAEADDNREWVKKLPNILRGFGAAAILFSLYSFMVRGWDGSSDLIRYAMLLGHTGLLALVALASGHFFKEGKGPRLLLMLALVSVPVNFSIIGAFILSTTQAINIGEYPTYVAWQVDSFATAMKTLVGALFILLPVVLLSFRTLARGMSAQMSGLYLMSNMVLLLPMRDPASVSFWGLLLGILTLVITAKTARQRTEVKTREGMMVLLMQFLPIGVLLGRSIWLYAPDTILAVSFSVMCFIALRQSAQMISEKSLVRLVLELISPIVALFGGFHLVDAMVSSGVPDSFAIISACLFAAGLIYEISMRASFYASFYRIIAMVVIVGGLLANIVINGGLLASMSCIILGISLMALSCQVQQRSMLVGGLVITIAGAMDHIQHLFHYFDFGYWLTLAIAGLIAIVFASVLEAKGTRIKQTLKEYQLRFSQWNY